MACKLRTDGGRHGCEVAAADEQAGQADAGADVRQERPDGRHLMRRAMEAKQHAGHHMCIMRRPAGT